MEKIDTFKYHGKLHRLDGYWMDLDSQRVWSEKTKRWLKLWKNYKGYVCVCLYDANGNRLTKIAIHRLVWTIANGMQIPDGYEVNHLDEDKENNAPSNLEICTCKQNINHGTRTERAARANTNGKKSKAVAQLTMDGRLVQTWPSTMEAHRNGWVSGAVSKCCRKCFNRQGNDVYKGYRWQWLDEYEKQQTPTTYDGQLEFAFEY